MTDVAKAPKKVANTKNVQKPAAHSPFSKMILAAVRALKDKKGSSRRKKVLWQEAKKYPLYSSLGKSEQYVFVGVTVDAEQEEFWDETRKLRDLHLFSSIIKLIEPKGSRKENCLDYEIGIAIGKSVKDLEATKDEEIKHFRKNILSVISKSVECRQQRGMESLATYQHPPELHPTPHLPESVKSLLEDGMLDLTLWFKSAKLITVRVSWDIFPDGIINEALPLTSAEDGGNSSGSVKGTASYALKICGTNEYLLANRPVSQYKTIRCWISQGKIPQLLLVSRGELYSSLNRFTFPSVSTTSDNERSVDEPSEKILSLWHPSMNGTLKIHILRAHNVPSKCASKFYIRTGLFHGNQLLCPIIETQHASAPQRWGEWVQFELPIQELPRATKIAFSLCSKGHANERKRRKLREHEDAMIGWANIQLFNFESRLIKGHIHVNLNPPPVGFDGLINPRGSSSNTGLLNSDAMQLEVEFERRFNQCILFPDEEQMQDYAKYIIKLEKEELKVASSEDELERIQALCAMTYPGKVLTTEEKEFLWKRRKLCCRIPDSLPRLLDAVDWRSRDYVSQLYLLLEEWPLVSPETALELLQYSFVDLKVREHAVTSLSRTLPDEKLSQYLLQLVHTLKHEAYLDSQLLEFLLHKSLTNKNLGYYFFWYLRSQVNQWPCPVRALVILEAFCRGLGPDLKTLVRHVEMVEKMAKLADMVRERRFDTQKERCKHLRKLLKENEFASALQHLPSPLRPSLTLGRLRISECKVLDSARRPIYLVWENADPMASHFSHTHALIFKGGDDLRQDMLNLQVIGIMVHAWTSEGLDLMMTPYSCLATGNKAGLIEVVRDASTVYSIQRRAKLGALQVDSSQLYKWIKDKNPGPRLCQAIETFTRSCAGYCVATFVLGIGDRHPDNIMVNEEGQIFHIDFGHFLGNFKKKFGIQRERVPFVLTQDFLKVIASGADNPKDSEQFLKFQELCGNAYLALRKHSRLILALFVLLISTGLPELQSAEDMDYLRKTLAVGANDEEALLYFQNQLNEAYGGAWTTKLDWFFHSVKHR